jgi:hypothetical protein
VCKIRRGREHDHDVAILQNGIQTFIALNVFFLKKGLRVATRKETNAYRKGGRYSILGRKSRETHETSMHRIFEDMISAVVVKKFLREQKSGTYGVVSDLLGRGEIHQR